MTFERFLGCAVSAERTRLHTVQYTSYAICVPCGCHMTADTAQPRRMWVGSGNETSLASTTFALLPESGNTNQIAEQPIIAFPAYVTSRHAGMCNAGTSEKWRSEPNNLPLKACAMGYSSLWD